MFWKRSVAFGLLVGLAALIGENRGSRIKGKGKRNGKVKMGVTLGDWKRTGRECMVWRLRQWLSAKLEVGNATFRFGPLTMVVCLSLAL